MENLSVDKKVTDLMESKLNKEKERENTSFFV